MQLNVVYIWVFFLTFRSIELKKALTSQLCKPFMTGMKVNKCKKKNIKTKATNKKIEKLTFRFQKDATDPVLKPFLL